MSMSVIDNVLSLLRVVNVHLFLNDIEHNFIVSVYIRINDRYLEA